MILSWREVERRLNMMQPEEVGVIQFPNDDAGLDLRIALESSSGSTLMCLFRHGESPVYTFDGGDVPERTKGALLHIVLTTNRNAVRFHEVRNRNFQVFVSRDARRPGHWLLGISDTYGNRLVGLPEVIGEFIRGGLAGQVNPPHEEFNSLAELAAHHITSIDRAWTRVRELEEAYTAKRP